MLINNLYTTKMTADKYSRGLNETGTLTITLTDYNGNPVANEKVELYSGGFNREGITSLNLATTLTTNSNGIATYTLPSIEYPVIEEYQCNGQSIYCKCDGWRVYCDETYVTVHYNLDYVRVQVHGNIAVTTSWKNLKTLPDELKPFQCVTNQIYYGTTVYVSVRDNGQIMIRDTGGSWTPAAEVELFYARQ